MKIDSQNIGKILLGAQKAYKNGKNVMAYIQKILKTKKITSELSILAAYDLQAGNYVKYYSKKNNFIKKWGRQIAPILGDMLPKNGRVLEVGVGEATTLAEIIKNLKGDFYGFDISWSRLNVANSWLKKNNCRASLFAGDLLNIPLKSSSFDIVYSSHSLEPNKGSEKKIIKELLRVSKKAVILIEPIYELANKKAKSRMTKLRYVTNLKKYSKECGAEILDYRLLDHVDNPLNPSGVIKLLKKPQITKPTIKENIWQCPITKTELVRKKDIFLSPSTGLIYPVIRGIPMLRPNHGIIASQIKK